MVEHAEPRPPCQLPQRVGQALHVDRPPALARTGLAVLALAHGVREQGRLALDAHLHK